MDSSRYITEVWGGCLGPSLPDGTRLVVDTTKPIRPGDVCTVVLRKQKGPWDRFMRAAWGDAMGGAAYPNVMGKLYLGRVSADGREALLLGQLYPPCVGVLGIEEVEALHRVVASAEPGTIKLCARQEDLDTFKLIAPFSSRAVSEPINPYWRPPEPVASLRVDAA